MKNQNSKQDIEIAVIKTKVQNLDKKLDKFITNEFKHLRGQVSWLFGTVVIGFLVSIALIVLSKYL
ncbi:MAG: hypothetical protein ACOC5T_03485 [Elusimicrobiota bacterium]